MAVRSIKALRLGAIALAGFVGFWLGLVVASGLFVG